MIFTGISKDFTLTNEQQYNTIGQFWDEMAMLYGLENLQGLGYCWNNNTISYAIGLKNDNIKGYNVSITLPDDGWIHICGETNQLKEIYDEIYKKGPLQFELETFYNDGTCEIRYFRTENP